MPTPGAAGRRRTGPTRTIAWCRAAQALFLLSAFLLAPVSSHAQDPRETASEVLGRGMLLMDGERYEEAAEFFGRYLADNPSELRVRRLLGECLQAEHRWEEARLQFQLVLDDPADDENTRAARRGLEAAEKRLSNREAFRLTVELHGHLAPPEAARDEVGYFVDFGRALEGAGLLREATSVYRYHLFNYGSSASIHRHLARVLEYRGDLAAAIEQHERFTNQSPEAEKGWADYLYMLRRVGDGAAALPVAEEAVARFGDRGDFRAELARLYQEQGRLIDAARQAQISGRCHPAYQDIQDLSDVREAARARVHELEDMVEGRQGALDAARELSGLYRSLGEHERALSLYRRLVVEHPAHLGLRRELAQSYFLAGDAEAAREEFQNLLRRSEDDPSTRVAYARLLSWMGRYGESLDAFEALRALAPLDHRLLMYEGFARLWSGEEEDARQLLEQALAHSPGDRLLEQQLAVLDGRYEEVLPAYVRHYNLDPLDRERVLALADLLFRMGELQRAEQLYRDFLADNPTDVRARTLHSQILAAQGNYIGAIRNTLYLIEQHPEQAKSRTLELANYMLWGGYYQDARTWLRPQLLQEPTDTRILLALGRACLWDGANFEALTYFSAARALDPSNEEIASAYEVAEAAARTLWEEEHLERCEVAEERAQPRFQRRGREVFFERVRPQGGGEPMSLETLLDEGRVLYQQGRIRRLVSLYERWLRARSILDPERERLSSFQGLLDRLRTAPRLLPHGIGQCPPREGVALPAFEPNTDVERYGDLIATYVELLEAEPGQPDALLALADLYYRRGDTSLAAQRYAEYLQEEPADHRTRLRLAFLHYNAAEYGLAADAFRWLEEPYGAYPCLYLYLANSLYWSDRFRSLGLALEVAELYRVFLSSYPESTWVFRPLAELYLVAGLQSEAFRYFELAMEADPGELDIVRAYALALADVGREQQAVKLLEDHGLRHDPQVLRMLIEGYLDRARGALLSPEVLSLMRDYLRKVPGDRRMRLEFARALSILGQRSEALQEFDRLVSEDPGDKNVLFELVGLLNASEDYGPALERVEAFLERFPDDVDARRLKADLLLWMGVTDRASRVFQIDAYRAYYEAHPGEAEATRLFASALVREGSHDEALVLIRSFRERDPFDMDIRRLEIRALLGAGQWAAAVQAIEAIGNRDPDMISLLITAKGNAGADPGEIERLVGRLSDLREAGRLEDEGLLIYARALSEVGRTARSVPVYYEYLSHRPDDHDVRFELAWRFLELERWGRRH